MEYITYKNRIAAVVDGEEVGEVTFAPQQYPERDGVYVINHTYVDDRLRGQGIASDLVRLAVEEIERRGGRVKATCSYAQLWLARLPEQQRMACDRSGANRGCELTSPLHCPIK